LKRAGELLAVLLDEGMLKNARNYSELFSSWTAIVEEPEVKIPAAAGHSRIVELERYILLVETDHPGWIQLLQTKQRQILNVLRRRFPSLTIKGISFRLSREPTTPNPGLWEKDQEQGEPQAGEEKSVPVNGGPDGEGSPDSRKDGSAGMYEKITDQGFKETLKRLERSIVLKNKAPEES
jgi:hypothetical protein